MAVMLIDSHAHLSGRALCGNAAMLIARAEKAQVKAIVDICTDQESLQHSLVLQKQFPHMWYIAAATTPHDASSCSEPLREEITLHARNKQLVAIGETGLDFTIPDYDKAAQVALLEMYSQMAKELNLPLIFHCRGAFATLFEIGAVSIDVPCVIHCFSGTQEEAKKALDLGWLLSISGIVTFPKSTQLRELISYIPLDRMLIETDSPYLAPIPHRGKMCEPAYVAETAKAVAALRGISFEEVALATAMNAIQFFRLPIELSLV